MVSADYRDKTKAIQIRVHQPLSKAFEAICQATANYRTTLSRASSGILAGIVRPNATIRNGLQLAVRFKRKQFSANLSKLPLAAFDSSCILRSFDRDDLCFRDDRVECPELFQGFDSFLCELWTLRSKSFLHFGQFRNSQSKHRRRSS